MLAVCDRLTTECQTLNNQRLKVFNFNSRVFRVSWEGFVVSLNGLPLNEDALIVFTLLNIRCNVLVDDSD